MESTNKQSESEQSLTKQLRKRGDSSYIPSPEEIKSRRQEAGLTQEQAAKMIRTTGRVWRFYESGKSRVHPGLWELFCIKLNGI